MKILLPLFGALLVSLLSVHSLTLSTSTSPNSFATQFGLDVVAASSSSSSAKEDVFARPTVGVLLVVDGESPISENEWTPFLKTLSKHESQPKAWREILTEEKLYKFRSFVREGLAVASSSLPDEMEDVQTYWKYVRNGVEAFLHQDAKSFWRNNVVVVEEDAVRLKAELALVEHLVGDMVKNKNTRPGVVIGAIHGLKDRNSKQRSQSMHELATSVESISRKLTSGTSRPVLTIVFTEKKQGPSASSVSEAEVFAEQSRRQLQTTKRIPFQGSDYVIMFWTIVAFIFLTIFVILCIPWAPALDPALRSTLKPDTKRE
jgi:hypothetical protein